MADIFTKTGEYFMAYDENNEEQVISFKHMAEDTIFNDGKDMEEKMDELFQYGNDFKQSIADAVIARGGKASANMTKDELTNAVLSLDKVQLTVKDIDVSTLKGNGGWTPNSGKLTPGNVVYLPLFDLVDDPTKLVVVIYRINGHYTSCGFIRVDENNAYYGKGLSVDITDATTYNGLVIGDGSLLHFPSLIDITKRASFLNDGTKTITITEVVAFVITK